MGVRGKDGAEYDDVNKLMAANTRWEQQEKQNKLLKEQNEQTRQNLALQQQMIEEERKNAERIANATRQAEEDRHNNEMELEEMKQKYKDEKRYEKMCDELGVVYNDIVEFEEWLNTISEEQRKYYVDIINKYRTFIYVGEIKKLDEKLTEDNKKLSEIYDNFRNLEAEEDDEEIKVAGVFKYGSEYEGSIEEIKEDIDNNKNIIKNKKNITIWLTIIALIVFIIAFLNKKFELAVWASIITFIIDSYSILQISNYTKGLYRLENALKKHSNSKNKFNSDIKSLEKIINKEEEELEKMKEERLKELENNSEFVEMKPQFDEALHIFPIEGVKEARRIYDRPNLLRFKEFRCTHYNKDIELLFRNMNINIGRISTSEIEKNGSIDDYIQYINDALAKEGK